MINSIIEAISVALSAEFTEKDYEIYMEEMKQGINEPCFFIACVKPHKELYRGRRYRAVNSFVIQYFPETADNIQRECNAVAERMVWCLEYVTLSGDDRPIRGSSISYEIIDGVLNFFINYDLFTTKQQDIPTMETIDFTPNAKE
jgi:hypothetical protein